MKNTVPVALFAYARPEHLRKTLKGLQSNHVPLIYAFSDGARTPDKLAAVEEVRETLRGVDWCDVKLIERESNLGLGKSVRAGVSEVFERFDRIVVVEDDIVFRPGAYEFVLKALERYKNDDRVMSISMWSDPSLLLPNMQNGFFAERFVCWGWATYRHYWQHFQGKPIELFKQCETRGIPVLQWGNDLQHQAEQAEAKNLWYVGYALTHFLNQKVSYFPSESLVVNIGHDGSGENCGAQATIDRSLIDQPVAVPQNFPDVQLEKKLSVKFANYFSPPLPKRSLIQKLRIVAGRLKRRLWLLPVNS